MTDSTKPTLDDLIQHQEQLLENYQPNPVVTKIAQGILDSLRELAAANKRADMLERRIRQMIGSNADDPKYYVNACQQAIRALDAAIDAARGKK